MCVLVGSCLATKVVIGNLPATGRGWVIISRPVMNSFGIIFICWLRSDSHFYCFTSTDELSYIRGGSRITIRGVLLAQMRANFLKTRPLSRKPRPFLCIFASQTELQQLRVNEVQISSKVSESTTLLASILVREGVLLIQMSARVSQISTLNV